MNPKEYKYTQEHEWICPEPGGKGKVGITSYAQSQLGDIVFLDLPAPGTRVTQFGKMGEVETVKAVADLFSPASGKILEINQAAIDEPRLVNDDPYGAGWLVRLELSQPSELDALMSSDEYEEFVAGLDKGD
ncbi:MAG TPA: glycine cleavage system protein GcvH [Dehalococcoidales bacterium]|nr:glycine cleavage system protein GcvH [Dehalococcoidales bacterium]